LRSSISRSGISSKICSKLRLAASESNTSAPNFPDASTHVRWSDWEVSRVERFKSVESVEYDEIVVCYCHYSPIEPEWKELPKIGVLQEGKF